MTNRLNRKLVKAPERAGRSRHGLHAFLKANCEMKTDGSAAPVPLGDVLADALRSWHRNTLYAKPDDWIFPSTKMKGRTLLSASMMAADKIRPAAVKIGIRLESSQRLVFHNFRHSLATFLISKGKDVKTIQGLLRHAKASTTLDLYSQAMDESKLAAGAIYAAFSVSCTPGRDVLGPSRWLLAHCGKPTRRSISWKRGSGRSVSTLRSALRK